MGSSGYKNAGLNGYDRNNKERDKLDYYGTRPKETLNILEVLGYDFSNQTILEPCIGGGYMANDIDEYLKASGATNVKKIGTDIMDRGFKKDDWETSYGLDFLADNYPIEKADVVIMNPPYSTLEPFLIRALEIAEHKLILLARLQCLEGVGRYENIFKDNPPSDLYVYVDRIDCWKNGEQPSGSSAQAYCWFIWNKDIKRDASHVHWIRRK